MTLEEEKGNDKKSANKNNNDTAAAFEGATPELNGCYCQANKRDQADACKKTKNKCFDHEEAAQTVIPCIQGIVECGTLPRFGSRAGRRAGTASLRLLPIFLSPQIQSAAERSTPKLIDRSHRRAPERSRPAKRGA